MIRFFMYVRLFIVLMCFCSWVYADDSGFPNNNKNESFDLYNQIQILQDRINHLTEEVEELQNKIQQLTQSRQLIFSEKEMYRDALQKMRSHQYQDSKKAFYAFLHMYPQSEKGSDSYYWIGEINRMQGMNLAASQAYLYGAKTYPTGDKAANSLMQLVYVLLQIHQKQQACQVGHYLISHYSKTSPKDLLYKVKHLLAHAKCK